MRTSITLDDDVYVFASVYAKARGITLGAAIGELVRSGHHMADAKVGHPEVRIAEDGFPVFRSHGRAMTPEMVRDAQEDDR
jgi:hypothetical protein